MPRTDVSMPTAALANGRFSSEDLGETVISIIAEVTRYPREILKLDSSLEEDLGIDSVKRTEILAVLQSRLGIPEDRNRTSGSPQTNGNGDDAAAEGDQPAAPRTIGDFVTAIETYLREADASASPAPAPVVLAKADGVKTNGVGANGPAHLPSSEAVQQQSVVDIIAEVTRFPRELLKHEADLEEDLGFDAGQRKAIFAALRTRLHLTLAEHAPLPAVKTIGDIESAVQALLPARHTETPHRPAVPAEPRAVHVQERSASAVVGRPFEGKVALVTGAGHGLGKAIAAHLARLGATVAVNSFHSRQRGEETTAEIVAEGGKAAHLWGSVTNPAHLKEIFGQIDSRFGGLDFFVSNASNGILAPLKDMQPEHWERAFRTNVVGLHQGSLLAAESMRRRGGGKIVALSSIGAQRYMDYLGCIGTVKAAVESLVRYLAVELGSDNIQVNAVSAGPVYGELMEKYPDLEKLRPRCEALTPRQRLNDEQEVAEAVTFLLGSSGMSGSVLLLDAGGCQRIRASMPA
jgi:enoyl-[acyl-carrier protein] reductase III